VIVLSDEIQKDYPRLFTSVKPILAFTYNAIALDGKVTSGEAYRYTLDKTEERSRQKFPSTQSPIVSPTFKADFPLALHVCIESLNATAGSVKFFVSDGITKSVFGKREYSARFPQRSTKYIYWELGLKHPAPGAKITFSIEAVWYKPDGSILYIGSTTKESINTYIESSWKDSLHSDKGVGWTEAGKWSPGLYRVDLFISGKKVDSGSFEIYPPVPTESPTAIKIGPLAAELKEVKFFATGEEPVPPLDQRQYATRFSNDSTHNIHWQLAFEHAKPGKDLTFKLRAIWYDPDGKLIKDETVDRPIKADWQRSCEWGLGWGYKSTN
jgi:hypothetical protein